MGKIVSVSSTVYNLAGDIKKRPQYLKSLVVGNVVSKNNFSMSDTINTGYLIGPGIKLRNFARWCDTSGYNAIMGLTYGNINTGETIDEDLLAATIPHPPGAVVQLQSSEIQRANARFFAEQYILENYPDQWSTAWLADFIPADGTILITFVGGATATFTPADYEDLAKYIYARYSFSYDPTIDPLVPGDPVSLAPGEAFPDVSDWVVVNDSLIVPTDVDLVKTITVTKSYDDGRPDEVTTTTEDTTESYGKVAGEFTKSTYNGATPGGNQTSTTDRTQYQEQFGTVETDTETDSSEEEIDDGVIMTTTIVTETESLKVTRQYRIDSQLTINSSWSPLHMFIYRQGNGTPALDPMFGAPTNMGQFFGYIPFRINNYPVIPIIMPVVYDWSKRAYKKATGGKFDKTLNDIANNESIGDIDYVYASFAVSLNSREMASLEYVYRFFRLIYDQTIEGSAYAEWKVKMAAAVASVDAHEAWFKAQEDEDDPLYGKPEPEVIPYPTMPQQAIQVASGFSPVMNYNMLITWAAMAENTGNGQRRPGAKRGDVWWSYWGFDEFPTKVFNGGYFEGDDVRVDQYVLTWQETDNTWREMSFWGLLHKNYIYQGKSADTTATQALSDPEESGFLVPLHQGIYRQMSIVRSTQMSTACAYLVFNCYEAKKKKWYQTGLFKVIVVIVIAIIAVYTGGAGAGLLGTASSVGASLGFTGMAAIVVGAVANALAAMILMQIIQMGATALFGEKVGAIIGAIVGIMAISVGTSIANGGSFSAGLGDLMRADNILKLTEAAGTGYAGYLKAGAQETLLEAQAYEAQAKTEMDKVNDLYQQNIGFDRGLLDPMNLTDAAQQLGFTPESLDSFMARTLMTGSEIVEMSQTLLTNFSALTLTLDLPT